jgi:hypothetical protein
MAIPPFFIGRDRTRFDLPAQQVKSEKLQKMVSFFEKMLHAADKLYTLTRLKFFPNK